MVALQVPFVMPQSLAFAVLMLGIGVFGFFTQVFLTMGLQRETASRGSLGFYVQILFAAIAERWIFHATPSYLSLIGTFIILICAAYVAVRTILSVLGFKNAYNVHSSARQRLWKFERLHTLSHKWMLTREIAWIV
jgi:drug/metabolite transporter (DMT)-like permease